MTIQELVDAQCAWLDTSQLQKASKKALIQVIVIALDHLKYHQTELGRETAMGSLCGQLLKLWETFEPPVQVCSREEVCVLIENYVQMLYGHFDKEWSGSRAYLTHQRESFEEAYHFLLLERRGDTHGGYREGAGRPATLADPVVLTFKVERETADRIRTRAKSEGRSYAELLRELVENS